MQDKADKKKSPSIIKVVFSVIAAAFGVQSSKNSERDFTTGNVLVFIAVAILFTFLFVMTIIGVVSLVLGT
ncbi:MAG: hypothetical protein ACJAZP_000105 [Psychromonas sp.]|uniref:DUF2970 domain-containing protein n=1 Tax=Psychromonas sp. TaxID=1884585 RepID=UPI0039E4B283